MATSPEYEWSYEDIKSDDFVKSLQDKVAEMKGTVLLHLSDGKIICGVRQAFLNLIYWGILRALNVDICKRHFIKRHPTNKGVMSGDLTRFLDEFVTDDKPENRGIFREALFKVNQDVYNFCSTRLLDFVATLDIMDMAKVLKDTKVQKIKKAVREASPEQGIPYVEALVAKKSQELMKLLGTRGGITTTDCLTNYQLLGYLNKFQVPQVIMSYSFRTDIDDTLIPTPVYGNAIEGLRDITEFAIEHTSAKKSQVYNKVGVSKSQYFGRKQHLIASTLHKIYPGDCGNNIPVKYHVTEKNYKSLEGNTIYVEGKPVVLTASDAKNYIGQDVYKRSPMTCRHTDGICEACGGKVLRNVHSTLNIGILSAIQVIEPITQKILSAKHLIKTDTVVYVVPESSADILKYNGTAEIRWAESMRPKLPGGYLGVDISEFPGLDRIANIKSDVTLTKAIAASKLTHYYLRKDGRISNHELLVNVEKSAPLFFSPEMLQYIANHLEACERTTDNNRGIFWIPITNASDLPIFRMTVLNDNMLQFVSSCDSFLATKSGIHGITSCSEALQKFSDIVHAKVELNLTHMEVLLKAYMVTNPVDYRIPQVADPDKVLFANYGYILTNRACGTTLAYEQLMNYITTPTTYLFPKQSGVFDNFTVTELRPRNR